MSTNIVYTEAFENMTDDQINYLSLWSEEDVVVERIENLVEKFESNITDNPEMYPPCHELTTLGVYNIRQFSFGGFKLLYEYHEHIDTAAALALVRDRQDLQTMLVDYCLIHK
ncbi:type II toxin-antitoxin system RelE/ParE family toxin [Vibrio jasicida]|uniref:type II toxin-antitoxin system RelE/ParE family toxin n=1 Tax=Vibrio jasicida TaxID=766224 RepID=UPI0005F001C0|nr:type II toxin-antitoxin system RelE/ParE family toxin [Vibrio jasicida]